MMTVDMGERSYSKQTTQKTSFVLLILISIIIKALIFILCYDFDTSMCVAFALKYI